MISGMKSSAMKRASWKGLLQFRVPEPWTEKREPDDTLAYFDKEDPGQSGTFRVKLMTFTTNDQVTPSVALAQLQSMTAEPGQSLEELSNGNALRSHQEELSPDDPLAGGERATFFVWLLASADPPHRMRLAVFTYAVAVTATKNPATARLIESLEREIRQAEFAHQLS
jgi:hypothetical protein